MDGRTTIRSGQDGIPSTDMSQRPRIVWVDDDGDFLALVDHLTCGVDLTTCLTVAEADKALTRGVTDLLVVDLSMPERNGIEFAEDAVDDDPGLPVVAVTAHASPTVVEAATHTGAIREVVDKHELDREWFAELRRTRTRRS